MISKSKYRNWNEIPDWSDRNMSFSATIPQHIYEKLSFISEDRGFESIQHSTLRAIEEWIRRYSPENNNPHDW